MKKQIIFLLVSILFIGCDALTGEEIGRLKINKVSTENNLVIKETIIELKKGDEISIWSDINISFKGDIAFEFRLEVFKDDEKIGFYKFDPTEKNITIGEVKTTLMDKTNWSFMGKNKELPIEKDGLYTFKGILVTSENETLQVKKAEIVFKK